MKRQITLLFIPLLALVASCGTTKDLAYMQTVEKQVTMERATLQDTRIMAKDILTVKVDASNPELVAAFNGIYWNPQQQYTSPNSGVNTYLVDTEGKVELPYLGLVKVGGYTLREAEEVIRKQLEVFLNEKPTVNVLIQNFRYSVLGEVQRPGAFTAPNGKVSVLEALASAGDMTIYGIRDDVKLYRENADGSQTVVSLNLKDISLLSSPYFYLQQGDVLYVLPNDAKASSSNVSTSASLWLSVSSIGIALVNLIFTLLR